MDSGHYVYEQIVDKSCIQHDDDRQDNIQQLNYPSSYILAAKRNKDAIDKGTKQQNEMQKENVVKVSGVSHDEGCEDASYCVCV